MSTWTYADEVRATLGDVVATIEAGGDPSAYLMAAKRALAGHPAEPYTDTIPEGSLDSEEIAAMMVERHLAPKAAVA